MEPERTWDDNQEIFHAFTDTEVKKNFNVLYKEFEDPCFYVRGCTNKLTSYLMKKNLIPKDEAHDPEENYVTLDLQIIQRAKIVKYANGHDVNLENSGSRAREEHANTYNAKFFDLVKTAFGETSLWVHTKPPHHSRDGHQVLKLI